MNRFRSDAGSSLIEVIEYGPVVFASDDLGESPILITINGVDEDSEEEDTEGEATE